MQIGSASSATAWANMVPGQTVQQAGTGFRCYDVTPEQANAVMAEADSHVDAATRAAWADLSDPKVINFYDAMERLTPKDRAVIKAATGFVVPERGSGARPLAPMLAFEIVMDRQNDSPLAGGTEISVGYFTGLIKKYAAAGTDATSLFGNGIYRAIDYLENQSPGTGTDKSTVQ